MQLPPLAIRGFVRGHRHPASDGSGADLARIFRSRSAPPPTSRFAFLRTSTSWSVPCCNATRATFVFNPVVAFLDASVFTSSDSGIRRALAPLADLLERRRCASTMVRHLNKQGGTNALYRGGAPSVCKPPAARVGWLAMPPTSPAAACWPRTKTTLPRFSKASPTSCMPRAMAPRPSAGSASACIRPTSCYRRGPPPVRDRARDFLNAFLKDGPRTSHDVWDDARKHGHSIITVRRAAKNIPVDFRRVFLGGVQKTYWLLPGQELPANASDPREDNDFWRAFAEQEKKFPRSCPLDADDDTEKTQ